MNRKGGAGLAAAVCIIATGCEQGVPKEALELSQVTLEKRQRQTRIFDTLDEARILASSAAVMQDLGYNLDESETELGILVGSKDRDATEAGQVVAAILVSALIGSPVGYETKQRIRLSIVSRPAAQKGNTAVRVTFQRVVWNNQGQISRIEALDDASLYQGFFDKLSQSVFLEANEVN